MPVDAHEGKKKKKKKAYLKATMEVWNTLYSNRGCYQSQFIERKQMLILSTFLIINNYHRTQ